jgi:hypothetical protein
MARIVSLLKCQLQNTANDKLLTYKEATAVTTLSEDILKRQIDEGHFIEGRHFIKVGTRVLFAPDLTALMFEDKLPEIKSEQKPVVHPHRKNVAKVPASPPKKRLTHGGVNPADLSYKGRAER